MDNISIHTSDNIDTESSIYLCTHLNSIHNEELTASKWEPVESEKKKKMESQ